jgi:peptidoglycan/LPS O-acetylase OafA/YrhL
MYIAHFLLLYYAVQYAQRLTGETFPDFSFQAGLIYIAIFVGATIIVSYATFVLIEQPFQRIGAALAIRCGQQGWRQAAGFFGTDTRSSISHSRP